VPLFFIISAFSMSLAYRGGIGDGASALRYALRRIFRIAPLFYLMLAAWLAYYAYLGSPFQGFGTLLSNLTLTFGITQNGIVPAGWSIGIEMLFYALFPFLILWRGFVSAGVLLVLGLIGAWAISRVEVAPFDFYHWTHPLTGAPYFALGLLAWRIYAALQDRRRDRLAHVLLARGVALLCALVIWGPPMPEVRDPVPLALICGWGMAFFLIVLSQALSPVRLIDNGLTRYLGRISYSLYLCHPLVIYGSGIPLHVAALAGDPLAVAIAAPLAAIALSLPPAILLYHAVERPFIALGRRLTSERAGAGPATPLAQA
jgi:peptidoglycan/LPS O-acetylase OafA/YrhL